MTRGQVASVSIGSGFRNAPGMPEPNIFNNFNNKNKGVGLVSYLYRPTAVLHSSPV